MANWKNLERKIAKLSGGKRVQRGADFSKSAADVEHSDFAFEAKWRSKGLDFFIKSLQQASSYTTDKEKIPVVVYKRKGLQGELAVLWLEDLVKLERKRG